MVRKIRFYYLLAGALFKKEWRKFSLGISIFVVFSLILLSLTPLVWKEVKATSDKLIKPVYIEAIVGKPATFNPVLSKTEAEKEINSLVFRGLMKVSEEGEIVGDLAQEVIVKTPTEYEFKLKRDIFWQDGRAFSAEDVLHTIKIAQNPSFGSDLQANFRDVQVSKEDDYTLTFKLNEPFAPFLTATTVGIIPAHIPLSEYRPIGNGEFKFVDIKEGEVVLEGSKNKLHFKFYPTEGAALTALKLGEVHGLSQITSVENEQALWENFAIVEKTLPLRLVLAFFNTRNNFFNQEGKVVRQALSYAITKETLVKNGSFLMGKVAVNSMPLLHPIQKEAKEKYVASVEKANTMLQNNGWKLEADNKRYKENKKLAFSITTVEGQEFEHTALELKKAWEQVGAQVNVNVVSATEFKNQVVPNRSFDVLLTSQILSSDPDQYVLWHTTQGRDANVSGIALAKLDKLLEDARKEQDEAKRTSTYQEFTRLLLDEAPAVFLYYPNYTWVHSKRIKNVNVDGFKEPYERFKNADHWEIERPLW